MRGAQAASLAVTTSTWDAHARARGDCDPGRQVSEAVEARGVVLRGRYELLETLTSSGDARVVKALDRQHARPVALKVRRGGADRGRQDLLRGASILPELTPPTSPPRVRGEFFEGDQAVDG